MDLTLWTWLVEASERWIWPAKMAFSNKHAVWWCTLAKDFGIRYRCWKCSNKQSMGFRPLNPGFSLLETDCWDWGLGLSVSIYPHVCSPSIWHKSIWASLTSHQWGLTSGFFCGAQQLKYRGNMMVRPINHRTLRKKTTWGNLIFRQNMPLNHQKTWDLITNKLGNMI